MIDVNNAADSRQKAPFATGAAEDSKAEAMVSALTVMLYSRMVGGSSEVLAIEGATSNAG